MSLAVKRLWRSLGAAPGAHLQWANHSDGTFRDKTCIYESDGGNIYSALKESSAALRLEFDLHGKNADEMKAATQEAHQTLAKKLQANKNGNMKARRPCLTEAMADLWRELRADLQEIADSANKQHAKMGHVLEEASRDPLADSSNKQHAKMGHVLEEASRDALCQHTDIEGCAQTVTEVMGISGKDPDAFCANVSGTATGIAEWIPPAWVVKALIESNHHQGLLNAPALESTESSSKDASAMVPRLAYRPKTTACRLICSSPQKKRACSLDGIEYRRKGPWCRMARVDKRNKKNGGRGRQVGRVNNQIALKGRVDKRNKKNGGRGRVFVQ